MSISPGLGPERLFEVERSGLQPVPEFGGQGSYAALGGAAECEAVALLLRRGHKVAVPVVDDDGVDLVVDYRTTVQVKRTRKTNSWGSYCISLEQSSSYGRRDGSRRSAVRDHVDVFLVLVDEVGWYVIPRASMPRKTLTIGVGLEQWREAWDVFDRA